MLRGGNEGGNPQGVDEGVNCQLWGLEAAGSRPVSL